ncbi:MAG TPA: class I tRNA ligase family protein [Polyangiales bacterium]|nr:class I tRNA ligase family protein [Polyangiales bacterium]
MILFVGGQKLSKSRGNVVNPDDIVAEFGADSMRVYEMFMGPLEATKPWSTSSIAGVRRFLDRVYAVAQRADAETRPDLPLTRLLHRTIRKVTDDIEGLRFNTAISAMMVLSNELMKLDRVPAEAIEVLAQLLHPFAPHLGEEVWEMLGRAPSIQRHPWPTYDAALCEEDQVEVPVQVNGKVRGRITLPKDASQDQALAAARELPTVAAQLDDKPLRKTIWVPGKILNLIV